jgi:hypothetical protein
MSLALPAMVTVHYILGTAYLYLDDGKRHRFGFSLTAFVICDPLMRKLCLHLPVNLLGRL